VTYRPTLSDLLALLGTAALWARCLGLERVAAEMEIATKRVQIEMERLAQEVGR
jgi:hypothetical protein